uniref:Uncharacterized protein n=1 Tax=Opuntia streptacantha TaxID=393608 RepID=A0A7C9AU41_OPUST
MECVRSFAHLSSIAAFPQALRRATKPKKSSCRVTAKLNSNDDPLLQAAIHAATLRFQETHRPEPLFHDPYVACLVPENTHLDEEQYTHPYCLATRFIDDKLLETLRNTDGLRQVVLLTDGADTRPYRLTWPSSTLIFDVSPDRIYMAASQKLKGIGAEIPRSCLLLHVPLECSSIEEALQNKGFNGNRPSIWALQVFMLPAFLI